MAGSKSLNGWSIGIEVTRVGWLNDQGTDGRWRRRVYDKKRKKWRYTRWYHPNEDPLVIGPHPNGGSTRAWPLYTPAQMSVLNELVPVLRDHYGLEVVGHDHISPGRKPDPGLCIDRGMFTTWNSGQDHPPPKNLRRGDSGPDVRKIQERLTELGFELGTVDGKFGRRTHDAVVRFQIVQSLEADGVVDGETWAALFRT